jgi:hypothetical protein
MSGGAATLPWYEEAQRRAAAGARAAATAMTGATDRLTMDGPVACAIRVQGVVTPAWADRFGGLAISPVANSWAGAPAATELRGELFGQAAVHSVLRALHACGLPLLWVACAPAGQRRATG